MTSISSIDYNRRFFEEIDSIREISKIVDNSQSTSDTSASVSINRKPFNAFETSIEEEILHRSIELKILLFIIMKNNLSYNLQTLIDNVVQNAINVALDRFQRRMSFMLSEFSESVESAESSESSESFGPFESSENSEVENDTTASR